MCSLQDLGTVSLVNPAIRLKREKSMGINKYFVVYNKNNPDSKLFFSQIKIDEAKNPQCTFKIHVGNTPYIPYVLFSIEVKIRI